MPKSSPHNSPDAQLAELRSQVATLERLVREKDARLQAFGEESEAQCFRKLFEDSSQPSLLMADGCFVEANRAALTLLGMTSLSEICGKRLHELSPPLQPDGSVSREKAADLLNRIGAAGRLNFEWEHQRLDRALFTVEVTLTALTEQTTPRLHVVWRDITESKRTETFRAQLSTIVENTSDFVATADLDGTVTYLNAAARQMLGIGVDEPANSLVISDTHPPDTAQLVLERAIPTAVSCGIWNGETVFRRRDGTTFPAIQTIMLHRGANGRPSSVSTIAKDISERIRAEQTTARLAAIVESADDAILSITPEGSVLSWNAGAERLYGYSAEEILGLGPEQILPGKQLSEEAGLVARLRAGESLPLFESVRRRKDGSLVEVALSVSAIRDSQGSLLAVSQIARDISDRKRTERLLDARWRLLETVGNTSMEVFMRQCIDEIERLTGSTIGFYHFVDADQQTLTLQAWSTNTTARMCTAEGTGRHYPIAEAGVWVDCVREGKPVIHNDYTSLSHRRGLPTGHAPVGRELLIPIHRQGIIVAIVGVGNKPHTYDDADVSNAHFLADFSWELVERKRREGERERLLAELSRSNTDLEQFAFVASHDLKAPLRAINHLATWLEEDLKDALTKDSQKHLELLRQRVRRMERFLEDLLLYSRAGRVSTDIATTNVRELFVDVVDLLAAPPGFVIQMTGEGLSFDTLVTPLRQVITNLIANAIKHHDASTGVVEFAVRDLGAQLEFTVSDDGPGIEPQFHEKIFAMFQTLRRRDEVEGSGIGLALVRRIVSLYGGTVTVSCREPRGATFSFTWPKEPMANVRIH